MNEFRRDIPYLLGFLALTIAFFIGIIFRTDEAVVGFILGDMSNLFVPMRQYAFSSIAHGVLPFWNPYIFCGVPFLADTFSAMFYPINLLFLCLPIHLAINYTVAAQMLLSGVFFYYYVRCFSRDRVSAFIASLVYMCGATQVCHIFAGHLCVLSTMIWLPLIFLFAEKYFQTRSRSYLLCGGGALALQILASHMQVVFYGCIALLLYCVFRCGLILRKGMRLKDCVGFGSAFPAIVLVGISLAAVQLLPALEFLHNSARGGASFEFCSYFSFPPENIITFLMPDFMGDSVHVRYWGRCYLWEMCAYIGIFPLLAAFFGALFRRDRHSAFFSGLACVSLVLAFGKYTPLLRFLYNYVPGFAFFRGNSKFILVTTFSLATLCARGVDDILDSRGDALRRFSRVVLILSLAVAIGSITAVFLQRGNLAPWKAILSYSASLQRLFNPPPDLSDAKFVAESRILAEQSLLTFSGFLLAGALILFWRARGALGPRAVRMLMILVVVVDLFVFGLRYMVSFPLQRAYWPRIVTDFLCEDKDYYRILTVDLFENMGMVHHVSNLTGYGPNSVTWYLDYIDQSQGMKEYTAGTLNFSPLFNLLNVKYILMSRAYRANEKYFPLKVKTPAMRVYFNEHFLPRAYLVHDMKIIPEKEEIFRELLSPSYDPRRSVILEDSDCPLAEDSPDVPGVEYARIESYSPNKVVVRAQVSGSAYLILADTWYPGWKALVDGRETKIYRANYIQRAVYLEPGAHAIEFVYSPASFKLGLGVSLATLAALIGVGFVKIVRRR